MAGKFVVKTASNGETYFRLQAGNGETILKSEMYSSKAAALNGICQRPPQWRHSRIGIKAPLHDRHIGATSGSA